MKIYDRQAEGQAFQGDLMIRHVGSLPQGLKDFPVENGVYIVAHSETQHHHVIDARPSVKVYKTDNPMLSYLEVIEATDEAEAVILRHLRSFDTHESITIKPGIYELRNQRESAPEGWRRAQD